MKEGECWTTHAESDREHLEIACVCAGVLRRWRGDLSLRWKLPLLLAEVESFEQHHRGRHQQWERDHDRLVPSKTVKSWVRFRARQPRENEAGRREERGLLECASVRALVGSVLALCVRERGV